MVIVDSSAPGGGGDNHQLAVVKWVCTEVGVDGWRSDWWLHSLMAVNSLGRVAAIIDIAKREQPGGYFCTH